MYEYKRMRKKNVRIYACFLEKLYLCNRKRNKEAVKPIFQVAKACW